MIDWGSFGLGFGACLLAGAAFIVGLALWDRHSYPDWRKADRPTYCARLRLMHGYDWIEALFRLASAEREADSSRGDTAKWEMACSEIAEAQYKLRELEALA